MTQFATRVNCPVKIPTKAELHDYIVRMNAAIRAEGRRPLKGRTMDEVRADRKKRADAKYRLRQIRNEMEKLLEEL